MDRAFDPRAWNLLTGIALVSGCGSHTISIDGESEGESATNTNPTTAEGGCNSDSDCPPGYYCQAGVCEYLPYDDGHHDGYWPYYECYNDSECANYSVCEFQYCEPVEFPLECDVVVPMPGPLDVPDAPLKLAFVDVDDDGAEELIVASAAQLHVFESGSLTPSSTPRTPESDSVAAMAGGSFDGAPGEDVVLLVGEELHLYPAMGVTFAPPLISPSPVPGSRGLIAGDFDGTPLSDMLLWGDDNGLWIDNALPQPLVPGLWVDAASVREFSSFDPGFGLQRDNELWFVNAQGVDAGMVPMRGIGNYAHTTLPTFGTESTIASSRITGWTLLELWQAGINGGAVAVPGVVVNLVGGDFNGDGSGDLALLGDDLRVLIWGDCRISLGVPNPVEAVFGDHDGDGDDELAVRTNDGQVLVMDIE